MSRTDWTQYPLTLKLDDVCEIYSVCRRAVYTAIANGDPNIPAPDFDRPYRWRRSTVQQHHGSHSLTWAERMRRAS